MLFSNAVAVFLAAGLSYASPIEKRVMTPMVNDGISMSSPYLAPREQPFVG